jgi:hypothetical protein
MVQGIASVAENCNMLCDNGGKTQGKQGRQRPSDNFQAALFLCFCLLHLSDLDFLQAIPTLVFEEPFGPLFYKLKRCFFAGFQMQIAQRRI